MGSDIDVAVPLVITRPATKPVTAREHDRERRAEPVIGMSGRTASTMPTSGMPGPERPRQ